MGMYLGPSCYDYVLNCHLVYLAIPGHVRSARKSKMCLLYTQTKKKRPIFMVMYLSIVKMLQQK